MAGIGFHKLECCGNDFVIVPDLNPEKWQEILLSPEKHAARFCNRRTGIGGDGVFFLDHIGRVIHLDPDGTASFCINGALCLSHLAQTRPGIPVSFELHGVTIDCVTVDDLPAVQFRPDLLEIQDMVINDVDCRYVHIGNPHLFIEILETDHLDNRELALSMRHHDRFEDQGTNVTFWYRKDDRIHLATFERGVEDFTPACGSACSAFAAAISNQPNVKFVTYSGKTLTVDRNPDTSLLTVRGIVQHVYEGHYLLD